MAVPTIKIAVSQADATLVQTVTLTAGMQNLPIVKFSFSDEWAGLGKTAVVRAGSVVLELLVVNNQITVPYEALEVAGVNLIIGVYGTDAAVAIPTVWCSCGEILDGTDVNEPSNVGEATPELVDQMIAYAGEIEAIAETLDGLAIRNVEVDDEDAGNYGITDVTVVDSGAGSNRTITFKFDNLKGNGIESVAWSALGQYRGRIQITESNGTVTNFDALIDAINYLESLTNRSEAYAIGTIDGIPVEEIDPDDPAYQNNAKYYAEMAGDALEGAETAQAAAETAQDKAEDAQTAAEAAQAAAESAEATATAAATSASSDAGSAAGSASSAAGSATSAAESASAATSARDYAETAQGLAEDARDDAQGYASQASGSATDAYNASQAVQNMGASASTLPAGSTATATKSVDQQTGAVTIAFGIPKGDKGDPGESGTPTDAQVQTAVDTWLDEHIDPTTGYAVDNTLSVTGAAADAKATGDAIAEQETKIDEELGYEEEEQASITYIDGYSISTSSGSYGAVIENTGYSVSEKISLAGVTEFIVYYSGTNPYGICTWYKADDTCISGANLPTSANKIQMTVTSDMAYIRTSTMTSRKNTTVKLKKTVQGKVYIELEDLNNAQAEIASEIENLESKIIMRKYMVDSPLKPLLAEFASHFWCSAIQPNVFTSKNVVITVSGSAGSDELTASAISPDTLSISDIGEGWVGGVLSADGVSFSVCNFKYVSGSTIKIFPALKENISNGILSNYMYDAANYSGLHLTENGYKAFAQHLYEQNPKHCEVGKYVERFRPDLSDTTVSPFTWYGSDQITPGNYRFTTQNRYNEFFGRYSTRAYTLLLSTSYTPHTTKSGVYWDVDLKGASGYLEAYIFAIAEGASSTLKLPDDQYIHVEVTIDGEKVYDEPITDIICKRVIVDYENAHTARLEIYSNKWYPINNYGYGFGLGRVTWWVNEQEYLDDVMFPKGVVIAQEFDSWGVFHDGASGTEMERLHNNATGVSVPYTNHSLGDQTSAWGKAWFYENAWKYNPKISIHDFLINDTNSLTSGIPSTIEGPDGTEYNNKLTSAQYAENMILLGKLATSNGIQPIFMRECINGQTGYYNFANALIDAMSRQVE